MDVYFKTVETVFLQAVQEIHEAKHPGTTLANTLARITGRSQVAVYKWLKGEHRIKFVDVIRLAKYYDISLDMVMEEANKREDAVKSLPFG